VRRTNLLRPTVESLEIRLVPSITVTTTLDTVTPNQISLRQAIIMVDNGEVPDNTIILPAGTYINFTSNQIISHSTILEGAGAASTIIDGGGTDRVFLINNPFQTLLVQMIGVTIRGGSTTGTGAGIYLEDGAGNSSSLTLTNCKVTGNIADSSNSTPKEYGGGIAANNGNITLINTQVSDNQVVGANDWGGGIGVGTGGTDNVTLINSTITGNTAGSAGGGLCMAEGGQGYLKITGSTISDNTLTGANYGGGGVFDESIRVVTITGSSIINNTSVLDGGGVDGTSIITLTGDTISGNRSTQGNGGGLAILNGTLLTVQDCAIVGNSAFLSGGGLSANNNTSTVIAGSTISDNVAAGENDITKDLGGGGISMVEGGGITISNCTVDDNFASAGPGGGLLADGTQRISYSWFGGNVAATDGGAIASGGGMQISMTTIKDNQAENGMGGAIDAGFGAILFNDTLESNSAEGAIGAGGAIYSPIEGSLTITNCLLLANGATGNGGAIDDENGSFSISGSEFTGNTSARIGGAIYFATNFAAAFTISSSTFNENQAGQRGGAFFCQDFDGAPRFTNDTFAGNAADEAGGAISVSEGSPIFLNDTINGNTTVSGTGGGISLNANGASFQNTLVALNNAPNNTSGPDVYLASAQTLVDNGGNLIGALGSANGNIGFGTATKSGNPLLGPLEDDGQNSAAFPTLAGAPDSSEAIQTEALLPGSPAIGAGVSTNAPTADERGFPRPGPAGVSIGAYEPQYNSNASAFQVYVENLYEVLLLRVADAGGLAFWTTQLQKGISASAVVAAFEGSTEYRTALVGILYERYLHRAPDPAGLQTFVQDLGGTMTIEQAAGAMIGSSEYFQLHGSNDLGFVDAIYEDGLSRLPDPAGQSMFLQDLANGTSQATATAMIFSSQEFQTNLIEGDYLALLGRPADPGGLSYFLNQLASGVTDQAIVAAMLGSQEAMSSRK